MVRDHHRLLRYTYPDGTAFSADDIIQRHEDHAEIILEPIA